MIETIIPEQDLQVKLITGRLSGKTSIELTLTPGHDKYYLDPCRPWVDNLVSGKTNKVIQTVPVGIELEELKNLLIKRQAEGY